MASFRLLVSATSADALSPANIRRVLRPSRVNFWATTVTVSDELSLFLDNTEIMASGTANVSAAAAGMVDVARDQLVFNTVVGRGDLRIPVGILTTSLIYLISVEPILPF